ncbi:MAG: hypothetical protein M0006_09145 [Magnetospirillum sp.]|nr:hypothetical protein [Magnetospirillum sp.]
MRRFILSVCVVLLAAVPAHAQEVPRWYAQVPLLPLAEGEHPDIEELLSAHWADYFRAGGELGFDLDQVRAGRVDLDGGDDGELVLMIDHPRWRADDGKPFVVAAWTGGRWVPVGWGWGEEDGVFVTTEVIDGWRTIDAGNFLMRWTAGGYQRERKPAGTGLSP